LLLVTLIAVFCGSLGAQPGYLGFDRNQYPGVANLGVLRQRFAFAGYWLSDPPGEHSNTWQGKRQSMEGAGFGFSGAVQRTAVRTLEE
jgi:hypothetical protein